jgi:transposase
MRVLSALMQSMSDLPDDIEILKQIVIEQRSRLLSNILQIEQLKLQLAKLRRMQFGRSSEQIDAQIAQLELTLRRSGSSIRGGTACGQRSASRTREASAPPATREPTARDARACNSL